MPTDSPPRQMEAYAPTRSSERLADQLLADIVSGALAPASVLAPPRLAAHHGVGLHVVRDALLLLEGWGVVTIRQGDVTRVRDWCSASAALLPRLRPDPNLAREFAELGPVLAALPPKNRIGRLLRNTLLEATA